MASEVVIVGDATRRSGLLRAVLQLGYDANLLDARELNRRVRSSESLRALLLCTADLDSGLVLAGLRRTRAGAAIPVILVGRLGGDLGSLADVLDLGADHFVEEPVDADTLAQALREFAGPVGGGESARGGESSGTRERDRGPHADPADIDRSEDVPMRGAGRGGTHVSRTERSKSPQDRSGSELSASHGTRTGTGTGGTGSGPLGSGARHATRRLSSTSGPQRLPTDAADRGLEWTTPVDRSGRPTGPQRPERLGAAELADSAASRERPARRDPEAPRGVPSDRSAALATTNVASRGSGRQEVTGSFRTQPRTSADDSGDPAMGQLHRTLDRLEARLRARDGEGPAGGQDPSDISAIDLDPYEDGVRGFRDDRSRHQTGMIERDGRDATPQAEFDDDDSDAGFLDPASRAGRSESAWSQTRDPRRSELRSLGAGRAGAGADDLDAIGDDRLVDAFDEDLDAALGDLPDEDEITVEPVTRIGGRELRAVPRLHDVERVSAGRPPPLDDEVTDPRALGPRAVKDGEDVDRTEVEFEPRADREEKTGEMTRSTNRQGERSDPREREGDDLPLRAVRSLRAVPSGELSREEARDRLGLGVARRVASGAASPAGASGTLKEQSLPQLLWSLHIDAYTGALELAHGRAEKVLWFREGNLHFVQSTAEGDRFVDGLVTRGVLTPSQWETARRLANKETRRAGKLLLEAGFLKPRELGEQIERHLEDCVARCLLWEDARWRTRPGELRDEPIGLRTTMAELLVRACIEYLDTSRSSAWLAGQRPCPRIVGHGNDGVAIRRVWATVTGGSDGARAQRTAAALAGKGCQEMLAAMTGRRALDELAATPSWDAQTIYGFAYALWVIGEVEWLEATASTPSMDPASVDSERIVDRLRIAREGDYFQLLGLTRDAVGSEVRRAHGMLKATFEDQALELRTLSDRARELAELRDALDEARDILVDDALRSAYLAHLVDPEPPASGEGAERRRAGRGPESRAPGPERGG